MNNQSSATILRPLLVPVFLPSVLMSIAEYALLPVIPASAEKLGADIPTSALIAGLLMVGVLLADLPAGRFVDQLGERKSMIYGSLIGAVGVVMVALGHNLWLMGSGVLLLGIGIAIFALARHAFFAEHIPLEFRARSLSLLGGTFRAGGFIGPVIGASIISLAGVEAVYWFCAAVCVLATFILVRSEKDTIKSTPQTKPGGIWQIAKRERKSLLTLGVGAGLLGAIRTTRQIGLPLWALYIGLAPEQGSFYIGLAGALDFALFYTSGQVMDRFGRFWAAVPPMLGLGLLHLTIVLVHDAPGFLILALAMALANGLGSGIILTIGADLAPPDARNEYLASYRLITDIGVASAPPLLSILAAGAGLGFAMGAFGCIGIFGGLLMWRYLPRLIPKRT